jgi:hypothetical protein
MKCSLKSCIKNQGNYNNFILLLIFNNIQYKLKKVPLHNYILPSVKKYSTFESVSVYFNSHIDEMMLVFCHTFTDIQIHSLPFIFK